MKLNKLVFIFLFVIFLFGCNLVYARDHPYFVRKVSLSPDGRYIGVGRYDFKIILLDRQERKVVKVIESNKPTLNWFNTFTPDSKYFVFQDYYRYLNFYDIAKDEIVKRIELDDGLDSLAFFKDMKHMIWGGSSGKIDVVNLETLESKTIKVKYPEVDIMNGPIRFIVISPSERYFFTTTYTNSTDLRREEPEEDIRPDVDIKDLRSRDVRHMGANLWDAKTYKKLYKFMARFLSGFTKGCFSNDEKYMLITSENGTTIWDIESDDLLYQNHILNNGCGFVDKDSKYFVVLYSGRPGVGLCNLQNAINPKDSRRIKKTIFEERIFSKDEDVNRICDDLIENGYINENGVVQEKALMLRGGVDLVLSNKYKRLNRDDIVGILQGQAPRAEKILDFKYMVSSWAMVTDPERNLIITGDIDGSVSVYKFNPETLEIELEWHPRSIVAGIIKWLDPMSVLFANKQEIESMTEQYRVNQLRLIDEDRKKDKVETKYKKLTVPLEE